MEISEIYDIYAEKSFLIFVKDLPEETAMNTLTKIWNTYLETKGADTSMGYYLETEKDIRKFMNETHYIKISLESPEKTFEWQLNKPFKDMIGKFVYVPDDKMSFYGFRFLNKKELTLLMLGEISAIYSYIVAEPSSYGDEIYSLAIYPHTKESGIEVLYEPRAIDLWHNLKKEYLNK